MVRMRRHGNGGLADDATLVYSEDGMARGLMGMSGNMVSIMRMTERIGNIRRMMARIVMMGRLGRLEMGGVNDRQWRK